MKKNPFFCLKRGVNLTLHSMAALQRRQHEWTGEKCTLVPGENKLFSCRSARNGGITMVVKKQHNTLEMSSVRRVREDKMAVFFCKQDDVGDHDHRFFELVYVMGGSAVHTLNGETGLLKEGDFFIVDYGSIHSYRQCRDFMLINCIFLPEIIDDTLAGCRSFDELMRVCLMRYYKKYFGQTLVDRIFQDEDGRVRSLMLGMKEEYQQKNTGYAEIFRCRLLEILILIMRKVVGEKRMDNMDSPQSIAVLEAVRYFDGHYREKAVITAFCQTCHYSLSYVSRRFKQETGLTAQEYIHKIRVEKCCEMLAGSSMPIQEIAREAGYEDPKFFQEIFRRMLGMTPREYRKMTK